MKIRRITPARENRTLNVAAYARVSTLSEEQGESFETQVEYYTTRIKNTANWNFVGVYADQGASGLSVEKRPGFQRMFRDAMAGKIDTILVKSISRFGRNGLEAQTYVHKLKERGVEVNFEREDVSSFNPQADMVFNFLVAVAQEESKSISQNIRWSYEKLAEQGTRHLGSNRVLGYDEVDGVLTPNESAWAVRFIFEEYARGKSMRRIADELENRGFETLRGRKKLSVATIEGMLRNELYKGDRRLQKAPHVDLLTHRPEPGTEYKTYYLEADHEGIVSKELWERVQRVLATPKKTYTNKNSHYLRGRILCGSCGEPY
ncbi:MAG: recombinase family protein, partial [Gemmiger sp.]